MKKFFEEIQLDVVRFSSDVITGSNDVELPIIPFNAFDAEGHYKFDSEGNALD